MDCSRHTNTNTYENLKGSHVDKFINKKFFKSLNELPGQIYEVEINKTFLFYPPAQQTYNVAT